VTSRVSVKTDGVNKECAIGEASGTNRLPIRRPYWEFIETLCQFQVAPFSPHELSRFTSVEGLIGD
jgi:hypothetical protein